MYRKIDTKIQNDAKFRALSDDGKLLFFLLLTHINLNQIGTLRGNAPGLAEEFKWDLESKFNPALSELTQKGMVKFDQEAGLFWLPKFLSYNLPQSPNAVTSWAHIPDAIPECEMKKEALHGAANTVSTKMSESFRNALPPEFTPYLNVETTAKMPTPSESPAVPGEVARGFDALPTEAGTLGEGGVAAPSGGEESNVLQLSGAEPPKVAITLPSNRGEEVPIMETLVAEYVLAYPKLDINGELRRMRVWLVSNPKERKTSRGMLRFVNGWLERSQNQGGQGGQRTLLPPSAVVVNKQEVLEQRNQKVVDELLQEFAAQQGPGTTAESAIPARAAAAA